MMMNGVVALQKKINKLEYIDINYVVCPSVVYDNATRLNTVRNACILFHIRLFDNASNERKQK